jgi:hypothetical protein
MKKNVLIISLLIGLFSIPLANADALGDKIREDILRKIAEDDARLRDGIPKEDPMLANGWVTDQPTFNYKLPCDLDKTPAVAVVVHGLNHMDLLEENDEGEFVYARDMSIAYPIMEELCFAIAIPKSGISTLWEDLWETENARYGTYRSSQYRAWWMTKGVEPSDSYIPVRDEKEEIKAIIDLIDVANSAVGKPVYLTIGNDLGALTAKVIIALGADGKINAIAGFIYVDRETGEFTAHLSDGTKWESKEH